MKELTKEDLKVYSDHLTVGKLKAFLEKYQLPDDAPVLIQRVEDIYFDKHSWGVYLKESDTTYFARKHNKDIDDGKFLDKEQFPDFHISHITKTSEEQMKEYMDQYHPAWACAYYKDDKDILFISSHY